MKRTILVFIVSVSIVISLLGKNNGTENPKFRLVKEIQWQQKVICKSFESKNDDGDDPVLNKSCTYLKFKTTSKGYPDFKGRYSYEYELYARNVSGNYTRIKNSDLFNGMKPQLISMLNTQLKKTFSSYKKDPETADCFEGKNYKPFDIEELGIEFDENSIIFHADFDLGSACMSVGGTDVSVSLSEIKKYLKL